VPVVVAAALALGACSSDGDQPEPTATQPSDAAPTTAAPQPTDDAPVETSDSEPEPTPEEPEPTPEAPDDAPADEVGEPAGAEFSAEEQQNSEYPSSAGVDGPLFVTDVRVASHDGYERVVFDFEGNGTPGWRAEYVDDTITDEAPQGVDLDGDAILRISVSGTRYPTTDEGMAMYDEGEGHHDANQAERVQDVYATGVFEGWSSGLVGLDEQAPFRVFTLTDPTRLVVDVSTAG
jgi:hypothetical protein